MYPLLWAHWFCKGDGKRWTKAFGCLQMPQRLSPAASVCNCGAIQQAAGIGLEPTMGEWVANIVSVMREIWRVLRDDGSRLA